jgi:hypothetical protein
VFAHGHCASRERCLFFMQWLDWLPGLDLHQHERPAKRIRVKLSQVCDGLDRHRCSRREKELRMECFLSFSMNLR